MQADNILNKDSFDLIYLFNVFYALPDQLRSLQKLAGLAKPDAILAIFDYTQTHSNNIQLKDLAEKKMNPIRIDDLKDWLKQTNWELIEVVDLSNKYEEWYSKSLETLKSQKDSLLQEFTEKTYDKVLSTFSFLSNKIKNKEMGGSMIYAKHNVTPRSSL